MNVTSRELPRVPGPRAKLFRSEASIAANAETVFGILVDLDRYEAWNPWVVRASGPAIAGRTFDVEAVLGGKRQTFAHTILVVEPNARFCWRDAGWNARFVYGQRCRTLTDAGAGMVRFANEVMIEGVLGGIGAKLYGDAIRAGLAAETEALRTRAEAFARG